MASPDNPVPTDTGQEHSPTREDYEYKKRQEKITRGAQTVEDRQSRDYWLEKEKARKDAIKAEKAASLKKEKVSVPKQPKGRGRGYGKQKKTGVEMPKAGFNRIGTAHHGLGRIEGDDGGMASGGAAGYSDPFAGMSGGMRAPSRSGVAFSVGSFEGLMGHEGMGGMYLDPFSSLTPGKRGRKPKDSYASPFAGMFGAPSRGRGRPPKSIFGSRLSLEMF